MGWFILLFLYITAISILSGDMIRPIIVHYLRRGLAAVYLGLAFVGLGVVWIIYLPVYLFVILIKILSFYFMLLSSVFRPAATLFGYIRVSQAKPDGKRVPIEGGFGPGKITADHIVDIRTVHSNEKRSIPARGELGSNRNRFSYRNTAGAEELHVRVGGSTF